MLRLPTRLAAAVLAAALNACVADGVTGLGSTGDVGRNTPTVGLSTMGFGFAVAAHDFTFAQSYGPTLEATQVSAGVALLGYGGGTARLELRDASGAVVLAQEFRSNVAQGSATARGTPPFTVRLVFDRFTGSFALGLGPDGGATGR